MIKVATVFSGIGAPEEALKQLNIDFDIVFACDNGEREIEKTYEEILEETKEMTSDERVSFVNGLYKLTNKENFVKKSYFANNKISNDKWYEDVRFIDGKKYKNSIDLLIGGSPCQSFSTFGKKKGFEDTRGTLFFHYANLIKEIRPSVFIYENVVGLKTHNGGNTWKRIQEVFDELEYNVFDFELNAKDYGLPQLRNRVFVVGFKNEMNVDKFDEPEKVELKKFATDYLSNKVDLKYYMGKKGFEWVTTPEKHQSRSRVNRDIIGCQTANQQFNWIGDFRIESPTDEMRNNEKIHIGLYDGKESVARKLTPEECLKLMGFENFHIVVDDKNAYRQSGNSIAVPVLKALLKNVVKIIEDYNERND
ncbi:MAG: DNA (cytosine-5-)-methyltransferase [Eubacterium sp.]|nr:DNA (cytosine-5-)-methyltransferase [Eubacterium sp.]